MCQFAEQIKLRVRTDLEQIGEAKGFIQEKQAILSAFAEKLDSSEKSLSELSKLLE